ncbi:MAG TPA: caspase family protein [Candidatus Angelobacter sp.]|nr:caspase family protein [Candidatus Angelobacter sp.]
MKARFVHRSGAAAIAEDFRERVARSFWFLLPLLAAALIFASAASAATTTGSQRRVALVIGNSAYQYAPHLPNPTNDAEAMAASLQKLGFEVTKGIDLDRTETEMIVRQFSKSLPGADVALLFYAGHGIQVGDQNYLIPVDAQLADETDLHFEATDLNLVMDLMSREPRVSLVFLDACRDNPFAQTLARSMGSTRSTSIGRGLAIVDAAAGSFIAYATTPHEVALDGNGNHSPFTAALLSHMDTPGLSVSDLMIDVRNDVLTATQNKQRPWDTSSLTSPFYFTPAVDVATTDTGPSPVSSNAVPTPAVDSTPAVDKEVVFWQSIQSSNSPAQYQAYLDQYPSGTFAPLARARIDELQPKPADTSRSSEQVASLTSPDTTVPTAEEDEQNLGLTRQGRSRVQLALTLLGYSTGGTDGVFGTRSRTAISAWQTARAETATGYLTAKQHAALLDAAAPKLAAWDAEQSRKAAEAQQQAAATRQMQQQDEQVVNTAGARQKQDDATKLAAAQAEAERQRQENEALKKKVAEKEAAQNDNAPNVNFGLGLGVGTGHSHGVSLFPNLSIFN